MIGMQIIQIVFFVVVVDSCLPVHMVYLVGSDNPDSGSVFSLDVLSTVPRIKNPAIFTPPSSCLKTSRKQSNSKVRYFVIQLLKDGLLEDISSKIQPCNSWCNQS